MSRYPAFLLSALLIACALASAVYGQETPPPAGGGAGGSESEADGAATAERKDGTIQINFNNVSLREIIKAMEKITGKRYLFDEALVANKMTSLFSSEAIPLSEVLPMFRSILEVEGLALVVTGAKGAEIHKIVDIQSALRRPTPTFTRADLEALRPGDDVVTLLFELKFIDPVEVASVLGSLTTLAEGIVAVPGTKLLRITDYSDNVRRLVSILELVDKEGPKVKTETIKLENIDPLDLVEEIAPLIAIENQAGAKIVQQQIQQQIQRLAQRKPGTIIQFAGSQYTPITLIPISRLGSIVVTAEEQKMQFVKDLVARLDIVDPTKKVVKYYELKYADPSSVASVVSSIFGISSTVGQRAARPKQQKPPQQGQPPQPQAAPEQKKIAAVIPDDDTGKLIVVAPAKAHEEIAVVIQNLDVPGPTDSVLKYFEILHTDLHETAKIISELFGLALDADMSRIQGAAGARRPGRKGEEDRLAVDRVVIPDENLNTLLVVADAETHEKIREALAKIDVAGVGEKVIKFYELKNADADDVANTIGSIFDITVNQAVSSAASGWWRRGRTPRVTSKADKNAVIVPNSEQHKVIVVASRSVHDEIEGIIADLDAKSPEENVLKYYPVEFADIHEAARVVTQVFNLSLGSMTQAGAGRPGSRGRVRGAQPEISKEAVVIPDEALSTLIVVAPEKLQVEVAEVIRKIDVQGPGAKVVRYYKLKHAPVDEIAEILGNIFGISVGESSQSGWNWWRRRNQQQQQPDKNAIILPNVEMSSIVVVASEKIQKEVAEVVDNLDVEGPGANVLKYYAIKFTDITETANIVSQIFGIQMGSPTNSFRRNWWWDESEQGKLTKERVIIPDDNLNSIIVVAPPDVQEEIEKAVAKIDVMGPRDNELRFYEVDNELVTAAAQTLSQIFNIPLGSSSQRRTARPASKSAKKFGVDPVIIPDEALGSVIVNAPAEIHAEVDKILGKLNFLGVQERMSIHFYKLKNTDAQTVAATLGGLFEITVSTPSASARTPASSGSRNRSSTQPRTSGSSTRRVEGRPSGGSYQPVGEEPGGGKPEEEDDEEGGGKTPAAGKAAPETREYTYSGKPVIVPDINLNSLIIVAPNYLHDEIAKVVARLDMRRPQVLFEIAIIDITSDSGLDFGVEYSTIDQASDNPRGAGFTNFGLGSRSSSTGTGFPDTTTVPTGATTQGLFAGITKNAAGSIPILIKALKTDSDVNIRATPILLVNDNQEASFSALRSEPTTHTSQGTATTNVSFSGFVDAGTVLQITPHVSEGNYIRLEIMVQVDSWIGTSGTPGIPPPKATNYLQTSITVPDEHVVIIGGLTSREKSVREDKIPLLGDIPLLGLLFRHEVTEEKVKKLFLFIKPVILSDREFIDLNRISDRKLEEAKLFLAGAQGEKDEGEDKEEEKPEEKAGKGGAGGGTAGK